MARILVIDDERDLRELIGAALERRGHDATSLKPDLSVISAIRKPDFARTFDLIITDVLMPDVDGIEIILALKTAHPACKVIAMSGGGQLDAEGYLKMAERLGVENTLVKPFEIAELYQAVDRTIHVS